MKIITLITLLFTLTIISSCTPTEVEVINNKQTVVLPDSLKMFFDNPSNVTMYNKALEDFGSSNYSLYPDSIVVSYGKNNNAINAQCPNGLPRNHISFQFYKGNKRIHFVTKPIKDFSSQGDEWVSGIIAEEGISFNPNFYKGNQFVYETAKYK